MQYDEVFASLPGLQGKVVAVTGTSTGLGLMVAATAVSKGAACVILTGRESQRARDSTDMIKGLSASGTSAVKFVPCDLQSLESVRKAASEIEAIAKQYSGLDVLCNNAGIMMFPDVRTGDGYDVQMQTNHLSHFLLTALLYPSLETAAAARGEARVVQVGSGMRNHKGGLQGKFLEKSEPDALGGNSFNPTMTRYSMTKLANAIFGVEMHYRLSKVSSKVKSISCEPGLVRTELGTNMYNANKSNCFCWVSCIGCMMNSGCNIPKMMGQTLADGSIALIVSCFGADTSSGDLLMPKDPLKGGGPIKPIAAGVEFIVERGEGKDEVLTMNKESQKILWDKSEAATGIKFL